MANTLEQQIDNIVGSGIASTVYDDWLKAGARQIVDILNDEDLERHSVSVTIPITTGVDASSYRIWRVLVGGYDATQYPAGFKHRSSAIILCTNPHRSLRHTSSTLARYAPTMVRTLQEHFSA